MSALAPETARGGGRAARGRRLTRSQDPRVGGDLGLLGQTAVARARWKDGWEKGPFHWGPVLSVAGHGGAATSFLAQARRSCWIRTAGEKLVRSRLHLGQGFCFAP